MYYIISYHFKSYHIISYYIILYYIILYNIILCYTILYCILLYYIVLYYIVLYYITLYCIILYHGYVMLCCVMLCYIYIPVISSSKLQFVPGSTSDLRLEDFSAVPNVSQSHWHFHSSACLRLILLPPVHFSASSQPATDLAQPHTSQSSTRKTHKSTTFLTLFKSLRVPPAILNCAFGEGGFNT